MKRVVLYLTSIALLATIVIGSPSSSASKLSQIEQDIKEANEQKKAAEQKAAEAASEAQKAEEEKNAIAVKVVDIEAELKKLMSEIEKVAQDKNKTEQEKDDKEEEMVITNQELEAAIAQVEQRDELLQKRTRLMYSNGAVSYLEVLLSSTSFTDFLDRFDALQMILQSDREALDQYKVDQELVEQKKVEVEEQLGALQVLYAKLEAEQASLVAKEAEKEKLIASYNAQSSELDAHIEELEVISEEQEQLLVGLASELSKLNAEKKRISNPYTGGTLGMPIADGYRLSSNFGVRIHPITGVKKAHNGIDFAAPSGTAIYAAESGVVLISKTWSGYGNCIIIDHGNGIWTLYGHIKNGGLLVNAGDTVKRGDKIALVGSTGNSTGPHLHFEVRKNEVPVNPSSYLQ
ncbi:MAG: peptidoglycan DD-metalloendopeptidase family protein [Candidatus Pristimantibacillus lignocellulolyticus]|uniref:Peptidoglycan DD-metalloendopeptidase family protein n=1 Tax=Candidatus Pristimantibacillus lignocellulolyticus TaxID=2994561 RepID=A0A9J6ZIW7_9BACL|nr:MAG: peptidoglycan DD-metalloendopeptidase family protein [Candidatus Pristimantibacillus lignocellulolyticus]